MVRFAGILVAGLGLTSCGPTWPAEETPSQIAIKRTLSTSSTNSFSISNCEAMVVELADDVPFLNFGRFTKVGDRTMFEPPAGWIATPVKPGAHKTYFEGAIGGCSGGSPLADFGGALHRPGSYYKLLNGGEGVIVLNPGAKLAGYFNFG